MTETKFRVRFTSMRPKHKGIVMTKIATLDEIMADAVEYDWDYNYKILTTDEWTGLQDYDRKDIFENDVVVHKNGFTYIVQWCPINAWWYLEQIRDKDTPYTGGIKGQDIWRCHVIGNFHDHIFHGVSCKCGKCKKGQRLGAMKKKVDE